MKKIVCLFQIVTITAIACVLGSAQPQMDSGLNRDEEVQAFNVLLEGGADDAVQARKAHEMVDVLDVRGDSVENILEIISRRTGLVFIIPEPVPGRVSLFIEQVNVWDLLKVVLQGQGLAYYRTNGAVHIMKSDVYQKRYGHEFPLSFPARVIPVHYADMETLITLVKAAKSREGRIWADVKNRQIIMIDTPEKLEELQALTAAHDVYLKTREFALQYADYETIRDGVNRILTKGVGRLEYRASEQKIVVTDTEVKLNAVQSFLEEKDQKIVVPFRVKIMRVALSEEHAQGIDWEAIVSDYQACVLRSGEEESAGASDRIHVGTVTRVDYDILVDALDTVGAQTHLIAFDFDPVLNRDGALDLDTNDPFWSLRPGVKRSQDGPVNLDPNGFEMKINFTLKKSGDHLQLEMFPRLHWMDYDGMEGDQKRHVFTGEEKIRLEFEGQDVVVIGGLIRTEEIARMRKFPLLGDLPVVGSVFRMERRRYTSTEYIIFLMPDVK